LRSYEQNERINFSFILHDIDNDGVPDLIIVDNGWRPTPMIYTIYTFRNGRVVELSYEPCGLPGIVAFTMPKDNRQGVIVTRYNRGFESYILYVIDGDMFIAEISATIAQRSDVDYTGWYDFDAFWEYITVYLINDEEVSREEFDRIFDEIFAHTRARNFQWLSPYAITEDNIHNIISGW